MSVEDNIITVSAVTGAPDEVEAVRCRLRLIYPDVDVSCESGRNGHFVLSSRKRSASELRCIWKTLLLEERRHPPDEAQRAKVMAALLA